MYFLMFLMELRRGQNIERWFFIWHPVEMLHLNVYAEHRKITKCLGLQ